MNWIHSNYSVLIKYRLLLALLAVCLTHTLYAQLRIVPIDRGYASEEKWEDTSNQRTNASLPLPFFDDFSTSKNGVPSLKNWVAGSGVYLNNTSSKSHPSLQMATFDGLNAAGLPYNEVNPLAQNFTDTLTSQPIDLAGKTAADSVYLSFYWMAKGLGELPDSSDYLQLEFLTNTSQWLPVWSRNGYKVDTLFHQQFVKISEPRFFHGAFQFRLRAYGRNSGPYDTWNVDYIYLNTKRSVRQPYLFDVAMRQPVTPLLRKYTAMPLRQFRVNPQAALADLVKTDMVNHFNNFNVLTSTYTITDAQRGTELFRNVQRSILIESLKSKSLEVKPSLPAINTSLDSIHLVSKYVITTTDTIPGVNLKTNDTISSRVSLADYYAYDDGTAEYGIQVNQKLARAAVQYVLSRPDTIGGVRAALVPFDKDISGQGFTIQILSSKNGKPDQIIAQRSVTASFAGGRNAFRDFKFASPVAVKDTFFVAWMQINEQPLTIGLDRNSMLGSNLVYYNLGAEWVKQQALSGSIMIRPYLGSGAQGVVTGTEPDNNLFFFPNPNKGQLHWEKAHLQQLDIFHSNGRHIQTIYPQKGQKSIGIDHLAHGIYMIRATLKNGSFVQKVLLAR